MLTTSDVGSILYLIKELAEFENALDSVQSSEQQLLQTLSFPKNKGAVEIADFTPGFARTFLLIVPNTKPDDDGPVAADGAVAGMALFFNNYSTWRGAPGVYLEDLYVRPQFRRKGYARLLLKALGKETLRLGGKRLEWSCLKWNENALKFYQSIGAQRQDEWVGLRVEGDALQNLGN
jgi:GNAT superfamily N-acetyltransferase